MHLHLLFKQYNIFPTSCPSRQKHLTLFYPSTQHTFKSYHTPHPKHPRAKEKQEKYGRGSREHIACERCFRGAPRRSTCPSYLMKRPLPMNLVNGSRLAPWQRNASLTGNMLPGPSPILFRPPSYFSVPLPSPTQKDTPLQVCLHNVNMIVSSPSSTSALIVPPIFSAKHLAIVSPSPELP